jgi:hypothetical protein
VSDSRITLPAGRVIDVLASQQQVAATESSNWFIDQAVKEHEALQAGSLDVFANSTAAPGGEIEYCGSLDDQAHWTAAYVRAEDEALLPLAVGPLERVLANITRIDRADTPIWDPRVLPPPVVVIDGARQHFRPARGRYLVGVVTTERRAVLLAAVGETLAVVHLDGKSRTVLFRGSLFSFREIDVDALLGAARGTAPPKVVRPPSSVRSHHARIVGRLPVDVGDGPAIPEVLWYCFDDLRRRAVVAPRAHPRQRRKGKTKVEVVVRALYEAGLVGCGNFEGLSGEILEQLKVFCPALEISAEVFADVLRLLLAAKTSIVEHPSPRIWRIRLVGLNDPRSPLHRQFCKETVGLYKHEPPRTVPTDPLPTSSTARPTNPPPTSPPDPPAHPPTSPPTISSPTSPPASVSEPSLELAGQVLSGPAAALAVLLLAVRATAQAEARAQAIARATTQVEYEEKLTEQAIAAAASARLASPSEPAAEVPAAAAPPSPAVDAPDVRASHDASETSAPRARLRQLRPLFAAMSCIASPPVGRARPTLAGLLPVASPMPEAEPARRPSIRSDKSEFGGGLAMTRRSLILGALGARGPPVPGVEPSQR